MFRQLKLNKSYLLAALLSIAPALIAPQVTAHEVEISGNVGGTIHIEPNDSPRAGAPNRTWFALTRRGGQAIPLSACNCQLAVYALPRRSNDTPILQPALSATAAQGRQGIPSANIAFPRAGAYEIVLQGQPITSGTFLPFQLRFSVTVAR